MIAAFSVFFVLLAARAAGFWSVLLREPGRFDAISLSLVARFAIWPILLAAGLWAVAFGLGRRAQISLESEPETPEGAVTAAALGLGLLGQAVFLLGWARGLSAVPLGALVLACAAVAAGAARLPKPGRRPAPGALAGAAAGLLAFAALGVLLDALAPPIGWDVRAYHLAIPELGLRDGAWLRLPWMVHSHWPHLMEDLYALPLAAGRDAAAALLSAGAGALLVAGVFLAGKRAAGPAAGWLAALLLAGQPTFLAEAGSAHSDVAAALFAFAAACALARWDERGGRGRLASAGLLAGLAAASKMTLVAPLASWALWLAAVRRRPRDAAVFLGAGALVLGPWFLKTWLETGSPVWPFLTRWGGSALDQALAARTLAVSRWGFPPPAWALTEDSPVFLCVPFAGLLILSRARGKPPCAEERWLSISAPLLILMTAPQRAAWRYLLPLWPAMALAAARWAAPLLEKKNARAAAAAALVGLGVYPIAAASPNNALFAVLGVRPSAAPDADRRAYWEDRALFGLTGFYRDARAVLPPGARVLLWREIRGYGAGFDYRWGDPVNQNLVEYRDLPDPAALCARLKALGVTYVLEHPASHIYQEDPGYYDARTLALMSGCLERGGRVVLKREGFALHQLL